MKLYTESEIDLEAMRFLKANKMPGRIVLKPLDAYKPELRNLTGRAVKYEKEKGKPRVYEINIDEHYLKRSNSSSRFMWFVLGCIVKEMNAAPNKFQLQKLVNEGKAVTTRDLYRELVKTRCPYIIENRDASDLWQYREYSIKEVKKGESPEGEEMYQVKVWKSTSLFTEYEMYIWNQDLVAELADMGITFVNGSLMKRELISYAKHIYETGAYPKGPMSTREYAQMIPFCEAEPFRYIRHSGGSVHHIKTKGAGGKDVAENYLHLSDTVHIEKFHTEQGRKEFCKAYPHLRAKVENAIGGSV